MPELGEPLSDRELDVLRCLSRGAGNKEIATELFISENTVKVHLRNIFTKLGVATRTEATAVALQQGVIVMPGVEMAVTSSAASPPPIVTPDLALVNEVPVSSPDLPATPAANPNRRRLVITAVSLTAVILLVLVVLIRQFNLTASATPPPYKPVDLGDNWAVIRPLPTPRTSMAAQAVGLNVYAISGETAEGVTDSVLAYEAQNGLWTEVASKPTAVTEASAASLFGEIFVPGGRLADGQPTNVLEVYSPTNNAWRVAQSLPQAIAGGLALSDGSFLYLFGGWDGEKYLDTAYVYDPVQDRWQPLPRMSHARASLAGGMLIGNLYAVGGFDGESILAVCEQFNPQTQEWQSCPDMLQPRARAGAASILNKLYVVGGEQAAAEAAPFSELFDPVGQQWTILNTPILANGTTWADLGAAHVETRLYMLGGEQDGRIVADSYQYSPLIYQTFIPAASSGGE